jgi:hypothetical protein
MYKSKIKQLKLSQIKNLSSKKVIYLIKHGYLDKIINNERLRIID